MPHARLILLAGLVAVAVPGVRAQDAKDVKPAPSKVVAVTVYGSTALVTREVTVPEAAGQTEVIVSPLPPATQESSLYAEGSDGIRVLTARYRTRAIREDNREEVRTLEAKIKATQKQLQQLQAELKVMEQNAAFVTKLEGFTAATLTTLTEKGHLDSEKTIALANFIRETRTKQAKDEIALKQQIAALQDDLGFTQRVLDEKAGGVSRTERDAVIVIDKTKAGAGSVRLNYLVSDSTWRPQYRIRSGAKDSVVLEYLAAVRQQTGEDWTNVALTLSTAQPQLNAAPPDLKSLEVSISTPGHPNPFAAGDPYAGLPAGPAKPGSSMAPKEYLRNLEERSQKLRAEAQDNLNKKMGEAGGKAANDAAALEQYRDLVASQEEVFRVSADLTSETLVAGGPSVTYALKTKVTLPSRNDEQMLEIARPELTGKFYYKAVPVLTANVYRLADVTNTTEMILLPGDANVYVGSDFVGSTKVPLVAIGKPFTVGFGADPQLSVQRKLLDKTRTTQGGNQVLTFKYQILLNSYKTAAVDVQVWDRMPHAEAANAIAVTLVKTTPSLSTEPLYVRDDKPKNLLRWDVKLDPKQNGDKALLIDYEYKLEFDRNVNIGAFLAK